MNIKNNCILMQKRNSRNQHWSENITRSWSTLWAYPSKEWTTIWTWSKT